MLISLTISALLLISQWGLEAESYDCGRYDATYKGEIKSPGYDSGAYPGNQFCEYKITAPEGYRIKLTFKDIDIDPTGSCVYDRVWISGKNRENILGTFCGTEIPYPVITKENDNEIEIIFETDDMVSGRGFHLVYESGPNLELCGSEVERVCRNRNCYHEMKQCDGKDDCGDGTDEEICGLPLVYPNENDCGNTPIEPDIESNAPDRQVGGTAAVPHSWPWQVSLQRIQIEPNGHFCGGSLISPRYVITAAHCVAEMENPRDLRITLGSHYKYKKSKYEVTRTAEFIVSYRNLMGKDLKNVDMRNDIAVIKLNAPVQYSDGIQPVCLPRQGFEASAGLRCYSTGWGETRGTGFEDQLKQTMQIVQHKDNCTYDVQTQICVDNTFNSPCHGDSGGPLVCKFGAKWYLMGAVSVVTSSNLIHGLCGMPDARQIFTKVSNKADWIKYQISRFG